MIGLQAGSFREIVDFCIELGMPVTPSKNGGVLENVKDFIRSGVKARAQVEHIAEYVLISFFIGFISCAMVFGGIIIFTG